MALQVSPVPDQELQRRLALSIPLNDCRTRIAREGRLRDGSLAADASLHSYSSGQSSTLTAKGRSAGFLPLLKSGLKRPTPPRSGEAARHQGNIRNHREPRTHAMMKVRKGYHGYIERYRLSDAVTPSHLPNNGLVDKASSALSCAFDRQLNLKFIGASGAGGSPKLAGNWAGVRPGNPP